MAVTYRPEEDDGHPIDHLSDDTCWLARGTWQKDDKPRVRRVEVVYSSEDAGVELEQEVKLKQEVELEKEGELGQEGELVQEGELEPYSALWRCIIVYCPCERRPLVYLDPNSLMIAPPGQKKGRRDVTLPCHSALRCPVNPRSCQRELTYPSSPPSFTSSLNSRPVLIKLASVFARALSKQSWLGKITPRNIIDAWMSGSGQLGHNLKKEDNYENVRTEIKKKK